MDNKTLKAFAPLPDYGDISDEHRARINETFMKYVSMLENLQSQNALLAAAVVALANHADYHAGFYVVKEHAEAIELARGIVGEE